MTQATRSVPQGTSASQSPALPVPPGHPVVSDGREIPRQLGRMRILSAVVVLAFAALTVLQLILAGQSLQTAAQDTAQLVRVQNIKANMLRADALATNAFLIGGLEAPEQRERYDESLALVSRGIAEAAQAQPLDRDVLVELNEVVLRYSEGMAQARATNRQGLPVGAGYLRDSSSLLRDRGVVLVDALVEANTERAGQSLNAHVPILLALPAIAALVVLGLMHQWLARRFRRRINTGLAGAAAAVLVLGIAAFAVSAAQAGANAHLREHDYATAVTGSEARSDANAAKTNESLRLVARGSGQAYEEAWVAFSGDVTDALDRPELSDAPRADWEEYVTAHDEVVRLDSGGDWDAAVTRATQREDGSASMHFSSFDAGMERLITESAATTSSTLRGGSPAFIVTTIATVIGGLAAAALAWRGVTARLKEYA